MRLSSERESAEALKGFLDAIVDCVFELRLDQNLPALRREHDKEQAEAMLADVMADIEPEWPGEEDISDQ